MDDRFRLFPERASTMAYQVDALYFYVLAISLFFIVLIAGLIIFFALRYHRSYQPQPGKPLTGILKLEIAWIAIPLLLSLSMFGWGAWLFMRQETAPQDAMEIYVLGKQWMWKVQHANGRREINELHIPVGRPVKLVMISEDVIHSFFIPAFRVKQDVLPGRFSTMWFEATKQGQFHLFCAEYCGTKHSEMGGRVVAMDPVDYQRWLAGEIETQPMADQGQWVFERLRCNNCHEGGGLSERRGPQLAGRFGQQVPLTGGDTAVFDAGYIRESILKPRRKVAAGYEPIMPTYEGQVSESEILAIIEYLKGGS
jgi:cytochrome c oxidase subunit II